MDYLTASAISWTVAGNSGISSFLTLFLLGCLERYDNTLLNMDEGMEKILTSWPSLMLLGILTIVEIVAMCVPVVDEITDTVMTGIVPVVSFVGTLGTLGLFPSNIDMDSVEANEGAVDDMNRFLQDAGESGGGSSGFLTFWKCVVVSVGVGLAVTMHLFKMLVRLIGEGWLTNILTVLETAWCTMTLICVVFIRTFAVLIATCLLSVAVYMWIRRCRRSRAQMKAEEEQRKRQLEMKQDGKVGSNSSNHFVSMT